MQCYRVKLFFYTIFCLCTCVYAQNSKQVAFNDLTVDDGLSQNSVVSITQDSIGYMWFATQDGLNKYQVHSFKYFNKQYQDITRLDYAQLGQLYTDHFGDLWSYDSTEEIQRYNYLDDSFKTINKVQDVTVLFRHNENELWLGTLNNGLKTLNLETGDVASLFNEQLSSVSTFDIQKIDDSIFLGTSQGLAKINNDGNLNFVESTVNLQISSIGKRASNLVLGTFQNGVKFLDTSSNQIRDNNYGLNASLNVQDVFLDSKNRLWIATYGNGLFLLTGDDKLTNFIANKEDPYALHYNDILKIFEDSTGNVWFGSDGAGLSFYDEHLVKFNVLTTKQVPENVNVDVVRSITVDKLNRIWLGTSGKGLTSLDIENKNYKTFTTDNSKLASNRVVSLLYDKGSIWIGHQAKGLQRLTKENSFQSFEELQTQAIWKIINGSNDRYWLCTRTSGLLLIDSDGNIIRAYNANNSNLTTNNIRTAEKGITNELWIGTENDGLFRLDLATNNITKIEEANFKIKALVYFDDKIWIGTNGNGIKNYDSNSNTFTDFKSGYELPNNVVYALIPDEKGNFWVTTNKGVSRFSPNSTTKHYIESFSPLNGLQAYEFNTGAYYKDHNGLIYFGGIDGVNWFNPEAITYNEVKPKTVISKFEVFGKEHSMNEELVFPYHQNTMTFTFSGLHFSHPEENFYRYKLVNHDENWSSPEYNNIAHYTNLSPNDYEFMVLSSNYEGIWNKVPTILKFTINKPWYATNLALIIYGLLFISAILLVYWYFKFRWEMQTQLKLEHAEAERLKQLDEFKKKLYTNISHEFRTPLTLISGPIEKQLGKSSIDTDDKKVLQLVKQNANRLLGLVNQMMDLSLLDAGQLKLKVKEGNLSILLKQLIAAFKFKAEEKKMSILSSISGLEKGWFDQDIIEKICSNLLSNAIKYAPPATEIIFDASERDNQLMLSVINQNNDVKADKLGKIFERFYQKNEASEGIGVGLALVKDLVTLSKGTILANTLEDNKIQFTVTLPLAEDAFDDFEKKPLKVPVKKSKSVIKADEKDLNKPAIFIIDDEKDVLDFVASIFQSQYQVVKLDSAIKAVDLIRKQLPDLVISDIMMPKVSGIELCNQLKNDPLTSHIPIVLLTAKVTKEQQRIGLETGADAYVTKPFDLETLKIRVNKLIETRRILKERFNEQPILTKALEVTSVEAEFMQRLKDVLDEQLVNPEFTADAFSKLMLMSRTQLHRKLKAVVGMTTSEFIRSQRLLLAKDLLKREKVTTSEVAYLVGFNSPSYFIKCFKEAFNQTPSQFQETHL